MKLTIRTLTVKATPTYACTRCGARAEGSVVNIKLTGLEAAPFEVSELLRNATRDVSNSHMPLGWEGSGLGVQRCPKCFTP